MEPQCNGENSENPTTWSVRWMIITAKRCEHSEGSEANNRGLFEIPRYLYYMCLHMHCTRPCTPCASPITSAHCALSFGTLAAVQSTTLRSWPLWGVALLLGMADGASSAEDSPDNDSDLGHTRTATGHRKHPDDNSNLGCTHTTTGHRKHSSSQTLAQWEERLAAERLQHIAFFTSSSYYTCTFPYTSSAYWTYIHTFRVSLLCYYSSFNCCMVVVWGMCLRIAYA